MSNKLLAIASLEEQTRREAIISEIAKLHNIVHTWHLTNAILNVPLEVYKNITLSAIEYDINMITKLNDYIKTNSNQLNNVTFPLKTNKNLELFNCAKNLIAEDFELMLNNSVSPKYHFDQFQPTVLGGINGDLKGTSFLNCLQVGLFTILSSNKGINNITHIQEFATENIYNVNYSANIQTTLLPPTFNHSAVDLNFKEWIYFYSDQYSPVQGELLFFTLGYSFGGSREDYRYSNKTLRTEDCSSALAKWVNSSIAFTTYNIGELFENNCISKECEAIPLTSLSTSLDNVIAGNVFAFRTYDLSRDPLKLNNTQAKGGHTGIVTQVYHDLNCFEGLSYARNMPDIEGLGYARECIDLHPERKYMFFSYNEDHNVEIMGLNHTPDEL